MGSWGSRLAGGRRQDDDRGACPFRDSDGSSHEQSLFGLSHRRHGSPTRRWQSYPSSSQPSVVCICLGHGGRVDSAVRRSCCSPRPSPSPHPPTATRSARGVTDGRSAAMAAELGPAPPAGQPSKLVRRANGATGSGPSSVVNGCGTACGESAGRHAFVRRANTHLRCAMARCAFPTSTRHSTDTSVDTELGLIRDMASAAPEDGAWAAARPRLTIWHARRATREECRRERQGRRGRLVHPFHSDVETDVPLGSDIAKAKATASGPAVPSQQTLPHPPSWSSGQNAPKRFCPPRNPRMASRKGQQQTSPSAPPSTLRPSAPGSADLIAPPFLACRRRRRRHRSSHVRGMGALSTLAWGPASPVDCHFGTATATVSSPVTPPVRTHRLGERRPYA